LDDGLSSRDVLNDKHTITDNRLDLARARNDLDRWSGRPIEHDRRLMDLARVAIEHKYVGVVDRRPGGDLAGGEQKVGGAGEVIDDVDLRVLAGERELELVAERGQGVDALARGDLESV
jgi:hypothetical protein